ncbi:MAG TPA: hypothetical protein VFV38_27210 [Ktedonobacteraceae bacterium]|nr:hypothetical protein [Ktedonobacteraceae bacterium]
MKLELDRIPPDLKSWNQWVNWRYQDRGGKKTKPPYSSRTGQLASVDDPRTWGSFVEACQAQVQRHYDGLAFVIAHWDPYTGIDLDHAAEEPGKIAPWARAVVDSIASYTEWSPSRNGLHIWVRAKVPGSRRRKGQVEIYDELRTLTVTGWHLEGTPLAIEERQEELDGLYRHLFPEEQRPAALPQPQVPTDLNDADLLARAERARNGHRFSRLWSGNTDDYGGDHSSADLALCGMLAYWCAGDPERMDRLFRQSGLMRDKWDARHYGSGETYGQRTIARALAGYVGVRPKVHAP